MTATPVLHLLVGPNGAGKSTLVTEVIGRRTGLPFVNADLIAADMWPGDEEAHAYDAARLAARERDRLLDARASFIAETVFSHESKLGLVRRASATGYVTYLHIVMIPEELCVHRVRERAGRGGHTVPEEKIRGRYQRLWPLVAQARDLVDHTTAYDNSVAATPFRMVAKHVRGRLVSESSWPAWAPTELR